jgi:hypothetical protein
MSYVKINANQSGVITREYNIVDFDIPAKVYDFSRTYVNLHMNFNYPGALSGDSRLGTFFWGGNYSKYFNSDIVENAHLHCDQVGSLEDIRRVNILTHNLKELTMSRAEQQNEQSYECSMLKTFDGTIFSVNQPLDLELERLGTTTSRQLLSPIMKVKLSDILVGLGDLKAYPGDKLGNSRLHLELRPDMFTPVLFNPFASTAGSLSDISANFAVAAAIATATDIVTNTGAYADVAAFQADTGLGVGSPIVLTDSVMVNYITALAFGGGEITVSLSRPIGAAAIAADTIPKNPVIGRAHALVGASVIGATTITLKGNYSLDTIPAYVGMPIRIPNQAAAAEMFQNVKGVALNAAGNVVLTIPNAITTAVANNNAIAFYYNDALGNDPQVSFEKAEIVLKELTGAKSKGGQLTYYTYSTEESSGTDQEAYSKLHYIEPECVNCFVMFPDTEGIISRNDAIKTYRLRINNMDTTNRDVKPYDPLYTDRLNMTLLNAGHRLKNSRFRSQRVTFGPNATSDTFMMLATPTALTSIDKQLQVNMELNGTAIGRITLYKQLLKTIKL